MAAPGVPAEPSPWLVIRPPRRWAPFNLRELWQFRDLLVRFARRDLTLRYRQTALGVLWVVLQPLLTAGAFAFVFGSVAGLSSQGVPYFAFAFAGMLAWNAFSGVLTRMSAVLVGNSALVSKIFFPRLVLPLSTVGSVLVDFVVSMLMMAVIWPLAGVAPGWSLVTLPLWLAAVLLLASGFGLLAAALMVPYRDVQYVLPVATQLLLFISPVGYALANVPHSARFLYELNPLTGLLEGFRWAVIGTARPDLFPALWGIGCAIACFVVGSFVFAHMERKFADVI
ncbi:MAG: transporter permease [Actinomycetia bacterium]|nr:transporter permease [Actinomycetes bacterium]